jgi:hypothetical protein
MAEDLAARGGCVGGGEKSGSQNVIAFAPLFARVFPGTMIAETFRQTLAICRARGGTIVAITLTVWLPLELLLSYLRFFVIDPDNYWREFRVATMAESFVGIIATAAVIHLAMAPERIGYGRSLGEGVLSWGRIVVTQLLVTAVILLGFLLLVVPGFVLMVRLCVAVQVAVVERVPPTVAISRSWDLTRGRAWQIVLVGLVYFAVCGVVVVLPIYLLPEIDNWLVDAAMSLGFDLILAFSIVTFTCLYKILSQPAPAGESFAPC